MKDAEAKVRGAWEKVTPYSHDGYFFISLHIDPTVIIGGDVFPGVYKIGDEAAAWTAALAFTASHAQKIAEVDEQIAVEQDHIDELGRAEGGRAAKRTLKMLQAHRDTLTRGWRGGM